MALPETQRLLEVVHTLRRKCPWDKKQTHHSLIRYFLEETYEAVEAIETKDDKALKEELGDVLLQVALHCEIARQRGKFSFEEVAESISDKMVRRHPHVYQNVKVRNEKEHQRNWSKLKEKEKPNRGLLDGIPKSMPALQLAQRYGEIAGSVGFDWDSAAPVFEKVKEEIAELEAELKARRKKQASPKRVAEELGDVLFTLANLARHLSIDSEGALKRAADKFSRRFRAIEIKKRGEGKRLADCSMEELEDAWNQVKKQAEGKRRAVSTGPKRRKPRTKPGSISSA